MARTTHRKRKYPNIQTALKGLGYTHAFVAEQVGLSRARITHLASGEKIKDLRAPILLSRLLGVPIESLSDVDAA